MKNWEKLRNEDVSFDEILKRKKKKHFVGSVLKGLNKKI